VAIQADPNPKRCSISAGQIAADNRRGSTSLVSLTCSHQVHEVHPRREPQARPVCPRSAPRRRRSRPHSVSMIGFLRAGPFSAT